ncbi:hypothetical protein LADH09A_001111 [Micromonospora sp. LAH09]|uniref:hypothetical protein n=1 Tax=Micromonospora cabrerizensis TaxID=2911213 RepID=UPI001EE81C7D|nr:hypothetical protein [Micromonospora cabrerizensis]MCG5467448.1 hypothetical protein [Micromonospora cabrerizensis]
MKVAVSEACRHRDFLKPESITVQPVRPCVDGAVDSRPGPISRAVMVGDGKNAAAGQQTPGSLLFISFIPVTYDCDRDQAVD